MPLPATGALSLQGCSRPGDTVHSKPKQAMIVRMSAETLELLEEFPNQLPMDFQFQGEPGIYIGDTFFPMQPQEERSPHDLYLRTSSAAKPMAPLKLYANVIGKFTVKRVLGEKVEDKVRDRTLTAQKKRTERTTILLDAPPELQATYGKKRKAPPPISRKPPRPNDVQLNQNPPPVPAQSLPIPISAPPSPKDGLMSVRTRLIHCLALTQRTADETVRLVGGSDCAPSVRIELLSLLKEVAEQVPSSKKGAEPTVRQWRLKTRSWLEVRPWEWPKLTEAERTNMARFARQEYNRLNIPESHPVWNHVRYRNNTNTMPAPSGTPSGPSTDQSKPAVSIDPPKRGVSSTEVKEKAAKAKRPKSEVLMKDESSKPSPKTSNGDATKGQKPDIAAGNGTSARRLPGSGFRAAKDSSQQIPITASQSKDKASSLPAKPATSKPPPNNERRMAAGSVPASVGRIKKTKDAVPGVDSDWERDRHENMDAVVSKDKDMDRAKNVEESGGLKRKKPPRELNDDFGSKTAMQKKRKKVEDAAYVAIKPMTSFQPRAKVKQEASPPPRAHPTKREQSPPPLLRSKVKRELSPQPARSSVSMPPAKLSNQRSDYAPERSEKAQKVVSKLRRRSPIYTSSDEEAPPPKPVIKHPPAPPLRTVPAHSSRPRESEPLPTDHDALRARYSSSYVEYLSSFQKVVAQRNKIEALLKNGTGSIGSVTDSDGDVELMDIAELTRVTAEHAARREELERIQQVFKS